MAELKDVRKGDTLDIRAWLDATEDKDGILTYKNVSADVHKMFDDAKAETDESGRVIRLVGNGVAAFVADATLKDEKKGERYLMEFVGLEALTIDGAAALVDGNLDVQAPAEGSKRAPGSVCSYFSQAFLQTFRNSATARLRTAIEGPEKKLDKAVELIAMARGISRDEAYKRVYGDSK